MGMKTFYSLSLIWDNSFIENALKKLQNKIYLPFTSEEIVCEEIVGVLLTVLGISFFGDTLILFLVLIKCDTIFKLLFLVTLLVCSLIFAFGFFTSFPDHVPPNNSMRSTSCSNLPTLSDTVLGFSLCSVLRNSISVTFGSNTG